MRPGFDSWIRKMPWRRKWKPTPVFLPGEFHGQRSLAGYSPWGTESDTTEELTLQTHSPYKKIFNKFIPEKEKKKGGENRSDCIHKPTRLKGSWAKCLAGSPIYLKLYQQERLSWSADPELQKDKDSLGLHDYLILNSQELPQPLSLCFSIWTEKACSPAVTPPCCHGNSGQTTCISAVACGPTSCLQHLTNLSSSKINT